MKWNLVSAGKEANKSTESVMSNHVVGVLEVSGLLCIWCLVTKDRGDFVTLMGVSCHI